MLAYVAGGKEEAKDLEGKLGSIEKDGGVAAGKIGSWFVKRYGMPEGESEPFALSTIADLSRIYRVSR